ncbi:MAG: hypothetical protein EOO90_03545 [Pedobacter sp.]|nr:MAG: hypothetical protein EOO90_03545 [Pedobacter sp.]
MRTPYLAEFRHQLSELNNRLSHYIFVWEQFAIDNSTIISEHKKLQTTKAYPTNKFAPQYDVKLEKLEVSHSETSIFILKSLFILLYTEFEVYIRSLYELARKADDSLPNLGVRERVPDKIFENLGILQAFEKKEVWTFDYFRLRRNRIMHSGGQSKGDLADIIKNKGYALQKYWQNRLTSGLFGLNFQSEETSHFIKEEIFDFINIWRILTTKIDGLICEYITDVKITHFLYIEFINEPSCNLKKWGKKRSKSKFIGYANMKFGLKLSEEDLSPFSFTGDVA